jgi:hypothetical protein
MERQIVVMSIQTALVTSVDARADVTFRCLPVGDPQLQRPVPRPDMVIQHQTLKQ